MTLGPRLQKLLEISSASLGVMPPHPLQLGPLRMSASLLAEMQALLEAKNGFFAFESALYVLPAPPACSPGAVDLQRWNRSDGWRRHYEPRTLSAFFFAQDIFCSQFGLTESNVVKLEPETGSVEFFATTLEEWADRLLLDYQIETGWHVAHEWQTLHGPLPPGHRLLPETPLLCKGEFNCANSLALPCEGAMEKLGSFHVQSRDIPDGISLEWYGWGNEIKPIAHDR